MSITTIICAFAGSILLENTLGHVVTEKILGNDPIIKKIDEKLSKKKANKAERVIPSKDISDEEIYDEECCIEADAD